MLRKLALVSALVLPAAVLALLAGCNRPGPGEPDAPPDPPQATRPAALPPAEESEHAHKPGAHGGSVVEIGRDNYHAEAVFEKGGVLRLYLLGKDEARVQEVPAQKLTAYARPEGAAEATAIDIEPEPADGDAPGQTSRFKATLPPGLASRKLEVTVPSIRINGERFRFAFSSPADAGHEAAMPAKVADQEEHDLYLSPGGLYTAADIEANGRTTASQKYQGVMASHDLKPRPGDRLCPVTLTKANPKFTWVVGGKVYSFCCPPCIDEFVRMAKEQPGDVREPEDYVKK